MSVPPEPAAPEPAREAAARGPAEPTCGPPAWLSGPAGEVDGVPLYARPLAPADAARERSFIARLSAQTLQQRVLGSIKPPTDEQIVQLVTPDWPRSLAVALFAGGNGGPARAAGEPEILAVARFGAADQHPGTAEFAIVVADRWQRRGLGHRLLALMIHAARAAGHRELVGTTFADNRGMIELARSHGCEVLPEPGEPTLRRLRLALDDAGVEGAVS